MVEKMTDAQKLRKLRKDKKLTQQGLANILGISQQTIAMVESYQRKASDGLKLAILRKYKIDLDEQPKFTNYEKIKNMTVDEMAEYIRSECFNSVFDGAVLSVNSIKQWLLSEVE